MIQPNQNTGWSIWIEEIYNNSQKRGHRVSTCPSSLFISHAIFWRDQLICIPRISFIEISNQPTSCSQPQDFQSHLRKYIQQPRLRVCVLPTEIYSRVYLSKSIDFGTAHDFKLHVTISGLKGTPRCTLPSLSISCLVYLLIFLSIRYGAGNESYFGEA